MYRKGNTMKFTLALAAVAAVAVAENEARDKPVTFLAQLYSGSSSCTGAYYAYPNSFGGCINKEIPGGGSAKMLIADVGSNFLTAWTERDCKGTPFLVVGNTVECDALEGTVAKSWSNDQRVFG
ncbi:hypothetical protein F5Y17DRAFT_272987 [Xylariaceae sp. FL0594]|nr:hypothetical protein F5Y17DRAFT_272987 [Xylariaceae sp. FL0594]